MMNRRNGRSRSGLRILESLWCCIIGKEDVLAGLEKKNDLKHRKILECLIRKIRKRRGELRVTFGTVTDKRFFQ